MAAVVVVHTAAEAAAFTQVVAADSTEEAPAAATTVEAATVEVSTAAAPTAAITKADRTLAAGSAACGEVMRGQPLGLGPGKDAPVPAMHRRAGTHLPAQLTRDPGTSAPCPQDPVPEWVAPRLAPLPMVIGIHLTLPMQHELR